MRKFNLRITSVVLLLVLTQSMGLRLMLHNTFHQNTNSHASAKSSPVNLQMYCDCVDEALMPSIEANAVELVAPEKEFIALEKNYEVFLSSATRIFHSLRGPPLPVA